MAKDDVVTVLTSALGGFERVVEHLRFRGEPEVANDFAKKMLDIVSDFNEITADWDIEKCLMEEPKLVAALPLTDQNGLINGQTGELVSNLRPGTWAAVAAIPTSQRNSLVVYRPTDGVRREIIQLHDEEEVYVPASEARVVWIKPKGPRISINTKMVSEVITEGPLYSVAYSQDDHAVCVIFQHPDQARAFLQASDHCFKMRGFALLGSSYDILPGQGYSNDAELKRMDPPRNERRRLTFVRSALFCDGLTEERFKKDIYNMVGEEHVELVWLFNIGNATAVFSSVAVARKCRDDFFHLSKKKGPYQGIQVSYSHDPCERPLHLVTQLNDSNASNPARRPPMRNGGSSYRPTPSAYVNGSSRRSHGRTSDEDGWQTVGRGGRR